MKVYQISKDSIWAANRFVIIDFDDMDSMPFCELTDGDGWYIKKEYLKEVDIDWETAKLIEAL